jgi:Ca-activated chloride channel homolog
VNLSFLEPVRLLLLLGVAGLAVAYLRAQRRRRAYAVRFTQLALLDKVAPRRPAWRRHVPAVAFLAAMALLVLGFARPEADVRVPREDATVVVAVDTSVSMRATDVEPSRFAAAQRAATAFVDEWPETFAVGLVSFSGTASLVVAPTRDHQAVRAGISELSLGPATAIGEAVYTSVAAARSTAADVSGGDPAPARVVLLSDGTNTAGRPPAAAARAAREAGVPVSTIAYGTASGVVVAQGREVPVPVDGPALQALAAATGGSFYEAASGDQLRSVYEDIGDAVGYRTRRREVATWFIGAALLAAMAAAAGSLRWFARLP